MGIGERPLRRRREIVFFKPSGSRDDSSEGRIVNRKANTMYDIIGDIHGHANELVRLLELMGYERRKGHYSHPDRKVIFLGDLIDRGPNILEVLQISRSMIDNGAALAVSLAIDPEIRRV